MNTKCRKTKAEKKTKALKKNISPSLKLKAKRKTKVETVQLNVV